MHAEDPDNFKIKPEWLIELDKCANRDTAPALKERLDMKSKCLRFNKIKSHHMILWISFRL